MPVPRWSGILHGPIIHIGVAECSNEFHLLKLTHLHVKVISILWVTATLCYLLVSLKSPNVRVRLFYMGLYGVNPYDPKYVRVLHFKKYSILIIVIIVL